MCSSFGRAVNLVHNGLERSAHGRNAAEFGNDATTPYDFGRFRRPGGAHQSGLAFLNLPSLYEMMPKLEIDKRQAQLILMALGIAIERTNHALENCPRISAKDEAIRERRRTLNEFRELRERIGDHFAPGRPLAS